MEKPPPTNLEHLQDVETRAVAELVPVTIKNRGPGGERHQVHRRPWPLAVSTRVAFVPQEIRADPAGRG
jgi:hypothetical protein